MRDLILEVSLKKRIEVINSIWKFGKIIPYERIFRCLKNDECRNKTS